MTDPKRSLGEVLFEQYLSSQGLTDWEFEKEHPGKSKRPDYTIQIDREYLFDVKEFQPQVLSADVGFYEPYGGIRNKIEEGRRKFQEFKDWPCSLILYNDGNAPLVHLTAPHIMFGAMLGNAGIVMPYNPDTGSANRDAMRSSFLGGGKMIRPQTIEPQNTTISALITLRYVGVGQARFQAHMHENEKRCRVLGEGWLTLKVDFDRTERQLGVVVWENPFARIPLSRDIFRGAYDERYGAEGDYLTRVFAGPGIDELETLLRKT